MNASLLVKQAWRVHCNSSSLIINSTRLKYHNDPFSAALTNKKPHKTTYSYRSLWKASTLLKAGFYRQIGNGKRTDIDKKLQSYQNQSFISHENLPWHYGKSVEKEEAKNGRSRDSPQKNMFPSNDTPSVCKLGTNWTGPQTIISVDGSWKKSEERKEL